MPSLALRLIHPVTQTTSSPPESHAPWHVTSASLNQLFLQDANGRKHMRDETTLWLARAGHEIQTLYIQNSLVASLVPSLSMSPTDLTNGTVGYRLWSPFHPPTPKSALQVRKLENFLFGPNCQSSGSMPSGMLPAPLNTF